MLIASIYQVDVIETLLWCHNVGILTVFLFNFCILRLNHFDWCKTFKQQEISWYPLLSITCDLELLVIIKFVQQHYDIIIESRLHLSDFLCPVTLLK